MGTSEIVRNIAEVRKRIEKRCLKNGVDPSSITVVGITKTFPAEVASQGVSAGLSDLGENKVQEAQVKIPLVRPRPTWHLVGHLQKNKTKKAIELFDVIESVDSLGLAESISSWSGKIEKKVTIYLQVNSSSESQKSGFDPSEILELIDDIKVLPNLRLAGLMTIGPLTEDMKRIERSFALTRTLFDKIVKIVGNGFDKLSMGMSGDYELALDFGANVLRLGTAIFGAREREKSATGG